MGQLTNHNTFRFSEGGPWSNPELIEPFVPCWGERHCNNVNYVKNNAIFEPPSMRACSSTPPKQNQAFVKEHNRTPLTASQLLFFALVHTLYLYFILHQNLHSTYLAYAFSKSATQNALGLWHLEKQRVSLIQGSRSSTRTSVQCPFCQNWNRNSPR